MNSFVVNQKDSINNHEINGNFYQYSISIKKKKKLGSKSFTINVFQMFKKMVISI